jgi:hypothetical protein
MTSDHETLLLEFGLVVDLLTVAFDLHGRTAVRPDSADDHHRLGALLLLLRDRAGQLHQRAGLRPRPVIDRTDCFDRLAREG